MILNKKITQESDSYLATSLLIGIMNDLLIEYSSLGKILKEMGTSNNDYKKQYKNNYIHELNFHNSEQKPINPLAIDGGFLKYCIKKGWLIRKGERRKVKYYVN